MMSAASQRSSISETSGPCASRAGSIMKSRAHRTLARATDVRELVSIAIDRTSAIGFFE